MPFNQHEKILSQISNKINFINILIELIRNHPLTRPPFTPMPPPDNLLPKTDWQPPGPFHVSHPNCPEGEVR
jgi:hypothetical protein